MGISAFLTEKPPGVKTVKNYNILVHGKEARHLKLSGNMIDVEKGWDTLSAMTVRVGGQLVPRGVEINDESGRQVRLTCCLCNLDRFGAFCCEKGFEIIIIAGNQPRHVQSKAENAFRCDKCDKSCNTSDELKKIKITMRRTMMRIKLC